jgi:hypothetical protein
MVVTQGELYAVMIGDVIASRAFPDQQLLFAALGDHFQWVNQHVPAEQPLQFTVGDEFQGAYREIAAAFRATILLKLKFRAQAHGGVERDGEFRIGLAYGQISVYDDGHAPYGQSGDAWWNARAAIDEASQPARQSGVPYAARTRFHAPDPLLTATANAFLLALDQVMYQMDRKDIAITLGILTGATQAEIASQLGISQPVVSRRSKTNGAYTIERILTEFEQALSR